MKLLHKTLEHYTRDIITLMLILNFGLIIVFPDAWVSTAIQRSSLRLALITLSFYFGSKGYEKPNNPELMITFEKEIIDGSIFYHAITYHTRDIIAIFMTLVWCIAVYLPSTFFGEVSARNMENVLTLITGYYFSDKLYKNNNKKSLTHTN